MEFYKLLGRYLLVVGIIIVLAVVVHLVTRPTGIHLTQAELMVESTLDYQPPPASVPADFGGTWTTVSLPNATMPALAVAQTGSRTGLQTQVTWYRVELPQATDPAEQGYLFIPRWKTDGQIAVYADGRLQYQSHANQQWNGSNRPLRIAFDVTDRSEPIRSIQIRLQHLQGIGGALSSLWVGSFDEVGPAFIVRNFFQSDLSYVCGVVFLATGLLSLIMWLGRQRERLYLLFFLMSVANFLRTLHTSMGLDRLPISDEWFGWITVNSLMWMFVVSQLFLRDVLQLQERWVTWMVGTLAVVLALVTLPVADFAIDPTLTSPIFYAAMFVAVNLMALSAIRAAWRSRSTEGMMLATWLLLINWLGVHDLLLQNNIVSIESYFVVPFLQIALVVAFFQAVAVRYLRAVAAVESSNLVLAERLAEREAELVDTHQRVREIEQRELLHTERQRLMEDMHDGLGSSLLGALRMVERGKLDESEIQQILQGCIDDLKLTIDSMEPVETDLLLLLGTLRFRLQPRLESSGIKLHWNVQDVPPLVWLDQRHALHILRVMQEAFTNIIKHAEATEATVTTEVRGGDIAISVTDNGVGFDTTAPRTGRGLHNQSRRASAIRARIEVSSDADGTQLTLLLPIRQPEGAAAAQ